MKTKIFLLTAAFLFILTSVTYGYERVDTTGKAGKISLVLQGIKTEQTNKTVAESNLNAAQNSLNTEKPDLEKKRDEKYQEANDLYVKFNLKYPEGSPELAEAQRQVNAANVAGKEYQDQIDVLQEAVDSAQKELDDVETALKDWQQQLQDIGNVSSADWNCFFHGQCGNYGSAPEKGKGFVIVPNTGPPITSGAPGIFTPLSQEYKDRYKVDNKNVPPAQTPPPQKGIVEQATEKVRGYFQDIIKRMQGTKVKRVSNAVLAVRG